MKSLQWFFMKLYKRDLLDNYLNSLLGLFSRFHCDITRINSSTMGAGKIELQVKQTEKN